MIELNTIYNENNCETAQRFENQSIDLIITSPPYKNAYEGIGINRGSKTAKYHYSNDVGEPLYQILDFSEAILPKLKSNGAYLLNWGYNKDSGALRPFYVVERLLKQGWFCPDRIIWRKKNPIPNTAYQLTNSFEDIFILTKSPSYKLSIENREYIQNVWDIAVDKGETEHNAAFPLELPLKAIQIFTNEGGLVYDPYMGSGTTALACKKLFRNYVGSEINKRYCDIVIENKLSQEILVLQNEAL